MAGVSRQAGVQVIRPSGNWGKSEESATPTTHTCTQHRDKQQAREYCADHNISNVYGKDNMKGHWETVTL